LFFVLIVIVPMVAVGVVVFRLIADNETAKVEARLAEGQAAAIGLYDESRKNALHALRRVGADPALEQALRSGDRGAARARARALLRAAGVTRILLAGRGHTVVDVGTPSAMAPASRDLFGSSGRSIGRLQVSVVTASRYARLVQRVEHRPAVVLRTGRVLGSSLPVAAARRLPDNGDVEVGHRSYRVATFTAPDFGGVPVRVSVLSDLSGASAGTASGRWLAVGLLAGFLLLAFGFAVAVSRALQSQIARFLHAARRLGSGDFSTRVPTAGHDEFAELGGEFNKMSRQLEARLDELNRERARLQDAVRRIGESVASNLDRDALLDVVLEAALDGVAANGGRATVRAGVGHDLVERSRAGSLDGFDVVLDQVEQEALRSGALAETTAQDASALAYPLRASESGDRVLGLIAVARRGRPFTADERQLFAYLAGQAAVSIENVDLHELVQRQAVTDELTGLSNHRRFKEVMAQEVGRSRRFGSDLGLVMLDIDRFKDVNDTYGHQQGDVVLREVARVLRESSREIDEPARYGGEELAVALPQTDLEGAYLFAERVRTALEARRIPRVDGAGGHLRVTASLGAAAMPGNGDDTAALIAAADAALYRAKRAGRNRTERAEKQSREPLAAE
ncbi:MAG TPA: diguanylate cyclase, partial [Solirubrobacteraceae bacterium]|nr:diguanylate cyclase [Solirubrobacteraceae bacterium]